MRLRRGQIVAGLSAETARSVAKACHASWTNEERIAHICKLADADTNAALEGLLAEGFVKRRVHAEGTDHEWAEWSTSVAGAALAMASFAPPMKRAKADQLLAGVLERVASYNTDEGKLYTITEVRVFGSYLDRQVAELGDLDLDISLVPRTAEAEEPETQLDYALKSGRHFSTFLDRLFWSRQELLQILRARSRYINVHVDEVQSLDVPCEVVYPAEVVVDPTEP